MSNDADGLGAGFELWRQLADDLAEALEVLTRGEFGARDRAIKLSLALRRLRPELPHPGALD